MSDSIDQLALISSVLGGFSFTFLSALLITEKKQKRIDFWVLLFLVLASMSFLLSALGWSVMGFESEAEDLMSHHQFLVKLFVTALISIILAIGLSGWIKDRKTGIVTSTISFLTLIVLFTQILNRYLTM